MPLPLDQESLQVLAYQSSGIKLGTFKSINESLTRVAVYVSLLSLYCLGGSKVKAVCSCSYSNFFLFPSSLRLEEQHILSLPVNKPALFHLSYLIIAG